MVIFPRDRLLCIGARGCTTYLLLIRCARSIFIDATRCDSESSSSHPLSSRRSISHRDFADIDRRCAALMPRTALVLRTDSETRLHQEPSKTLAFEGPTQHLGLQQETRHRTCREMRKGGDSIHASRAGCVVKDEVLVQACARRPLGGTIWHHPIRIPAARGWGVPLPRSIRGLSRPWTLLLPREICSGILARHCAGHKPRS